MNRSDLSLVVVSSLVALLGMAGCRRSEFSEEMLSGKWSQVKQVTVTHAIGQVSGGEDLTSRVRWRFSGDGTGLHRVSDGTEYEVEWTLIGQESLVLEEEHASGRVVDTLDLIWESGRAFQMYQLQEIDSLHWVEYTYYLEKGW